MTEGLMPALAAVWTSYALATLIPGPNVVSVTTSALLGGRKRGLSAASGVALATLLWCVAGAFGLSAAIEARPELLPWLRLGGGMVLAYLGLSILRDEGTGEVEGAGEGFGSAFAAALANPLNALIWTSLAGLVLRAGPTGAELALYVASCATLAFVIHGTLAVTVAAAGRDRVRTGRTARTFCGGAFLFLSGMLVGG